jgi:hypothetical protein
MPHYFQYAGFAGIGRGISHVAAIHVSTAEISPNLQTVRRVYNSSCAPKFNGRE